MKQLQKQFLVLISSIALVMSASIASANNSDQYVIDEPTGMAKFGDAILARPFMLVVSVLGTATYVVSLPFTLPSGSHDSALESFVVKPWSDTFTRCLGCTEQHMIQHEKAMAEAKLREEAEAKKQAEAEAKQSVQ